MQNFKLFSVRCLLYGKGAIALTNDRKVIGTNSEVIFDSFVKVRFAYHKILFMYSVPFNNFSKLTELCSHYHSLALDVVQDSKKEARVPF